MSPSDDKRSGLSLKTLLIASAASATASFVVPMIWQPGTIPAAAAMPVIVALISDALSRPAERVREAGKLVRVPRRNRRRKLTETDRRRIRIALVTGLLAFGLVAVVLTVTELAAGGAVSSDRRTTLLGGGTPERESTPAPASPGVAPDGDTASPTEPSATPTPVPEGTPSPAEGQPTPAPAPGTAPPAPEPTPETGSPVPAPTP